MVQLLAMREDLRELARPAEHADGRGAVDTRRRSRQIVFDQREGALLIVEDVLGAHVQHAWRCGAGTLAPHVGSEESSRLVFGRLALFGASKPREQREQRRGQQGVYRGRHRRGSHGEAREACPLNMPPPSEDSKIR